MRSHCLKTWPEMFKAVKNGVKSFEIRKNDRDFRVDDVLILEEWDNVIEKYTGDGVTADVVYIAQGVFGLPADLCVMQIKVRP